jgi:hypothetical protein
VAVDGADADLGAARDIVHLRIPAALGEGRAGGGDDLLSIAPGVRAQRAPRGVAESDDDL